MKHDRERCLVLEASSWEACEDHLGVTLIQSGRRRYRQKKPGIFDKIPIRVEPRDGYVPSLSIDGRGGAFYIYANLSPDKELERKDMRAWK